MGVELWRVIKFAEVPRHRGWAMFERMLHFGPTTTVTNQDELRAIDAGCYLQHCGRWHKIKAMGPGGKVLTTAGVWLDLYNTGRPIRFQQPSELGKTLLTIALTAAPGVVSLIWHIVNYIRDSGH